MNVKKKLADTKAKLKKNAPQIVVIGSAAVAIAYGLYTTTKKTIPVLIESATLNDVADSEDFEMPSGAWEVIVAMSGDDLTTLSENDSFKVTHIDEDLFRAKVITTD